MHEMQSLLYIADDIWDPVCSIVLNVSKMLGDGRHKLGVKEIQERKYLSFIEDDI
jgi:hypothetical protein